MTEEQRREFSLWLDGWTAFPPSEETLRAVLTEHSRMESAIVGLLETHGDDAGWPAGARDVLMAAVGMARADDPCVRKDTATALLREARPSVEELELAGYKVGPLLERIDAFLAGQPAPKSAESEARMLRKCLARVRATIDSDEELKALYVAAAAKMPLDHAEDDGLRAREALCGGDADPKP